MQVSNKKYLLTKLYEADTWLSSNGGIYES